MMEESKLLDERAWVYETFGQVKLGDKRLERRLLKLTSQMLETPESSLPKQVHGGWHPLKAAYRFFANEAVSFEALSQPHWQQTREQLNQEAGVVLLVHDTTELDYGYAPATRGLGSIGNGSHRGFLLQSVLAVRAADGQVLGIAAQEPLVRKKAPRRPSGKKESGQQRSKRERESELWLRGVRAVGTPSGSSQLVHVADSGADMFDLFWQCRAMKTDFVIRACQDRLLVEENGEGPDEEPSKLMQRARALPARGRREIEVASEHERKRRQAKMQISWQEVELPASSVSKQPEAAGTTLKVWIVRAWEVDPPLKSEGERARKEPKKHRRKSKQAESEQVEALEWVLISSVPVSSEAEAWERVEWYKRRWVVEDYHHGLKTGCGIEKRHLGEEASLERMLGVLAPMALRLLQLRDLLEGHPQEEAAVWFSEEELLVMSAQSGQRAQEWTVEHALRTIAMWGGFLGRKSDGQPGWKSLWEGWERLNLLVQGMRLAHTWSS